MGRQGSSFAKRKLYRCHEYGRLQAAISHLQGFFRGPVDGPWRFQEGNIPVE
jgi:hypothetical protein